MTKTLFDLVAITVCVVAFSSARAEEATQPKSTIKKLDLGVSRPKPVLSEKSGPETALDDSVLEATKPSDKNFKVNCMGKHNAVYKNGSPGYDSCMQEQNAPINRDAAEQQRIMQLENGSAR